MSGNVVSLHLSDAQHEALERYGMRACVTAPRRVEVTYATLSGFQRFMAEADTDPVLMPLGLRGGEYRRPHYGILYQPSAQITP